MSVRRIAANPRRETGTYFNKFLSFFIRILKGNIHAFLLETASVLLLGVFVVVVLVQSGAELGSLAHGVGWTAVVRTVAPHGCLEMLSILVNGGVSLAMAHTLVKGLLQGALPPAPVVAVYVAIVGGALAILVTAAYIEAYVTPSLTRLWLSQG